MQSEKRRRDVQRILTRALVLEIMLISATNASAGTAAEPETPWWRQQKIVFMWGQWNYARVDKSVDYWIGELPREHFRHVARSGGTVFAEKVGMVKGHAYRPAHARHAHDFGLKYFVTRYVGLPRYKVSPHDSGRKWVNERGEEPGGQYNCTLEPERYEKWLVEPILEGVRQGLIDGIHVDWENYRGTHECGICYCDICFSRFLQFKKIEADLPAKPDRFPWLNQQDLVVAYKQNFHDRRYEMFTALRKKLHAANPDLMFSSYDVLRPSHDGGHGLYAPAWDYVRAMHTPRTSYWTPDIMARTIASHGGSPTVRG